MKEQSDVISLLDIVWDKSRNKSWLRINSMMAMSLRLAIYARLKFERDDFIEIEKKYRSGYWLREEIYRYCCEEKNTSACFSYEKWLGFKPFLWKNIRMYPGFSFQASMGFYQVTSLKGDKLIVCSYKTISEASYAALSRMNPNSNRRRRTIKRRITLTHSSLYQNDIRAEFFRKEQGGK